MSLAINNPDTFFINLGSGGLGGWAQDNPEQGRKLGKIVGTTERTGTPFENRQFTTPTSGSYQCEPFAIASTIYKYFGLQNPELLTGENAIDEVSTTNERI